MKKTELFKAYEYYNRIINILESGDTNYPEGSLRISVDKNIIRYYQCIDDCESTQKYIHANELMLAKNLAQKQYNEKLLKLVKKRMGQINRLIKDYDDFEIDKLFEDLHPARKKLIVPIEKTYEQKYEEWLKAEYQGKEFKEGTPLILTEKNERVRSKSEKIMADYFYRNGIEYKYEKPLYLNGYGIVYPDFTFYSKKKGQEVYWEHDGKMDDPEYASSAIKKIELYENNGLYIGDRLIVTFESLTKVLNTNEIERNIKRLL